MASAVNYTVREFGLQLDQPPAIGNISSLAVVILKNDNAEGILEFRQDFAAIRGKSQNKGDQSILNLCCMWKINYCINMHWVFVFQSKRMWVLF